MNDILLDQIVEAVLEEIVNETADLGMGIEGDRDPELEKEPETKDPTDLSPENNEIVKKIQTAATLVDKESESIIQNLVFQQS